MGMQLILIFLPPPPQGDKKVHGGWVGVGGILQSWQNIDIIAMEFITV